MAVRQQSNKLSQLFRNKIKKIRCAIFLKDFRQCAVYSVHIALACCFINLPFSCYNPVSCIASKNNIGGAPKIPFMSHLNGSYLYGHWDITYQSAINYYASRLMCDILYSILYRKLPYNVSYTEKQQKITNICRDD